MGRLRFLVAAAAIALAGCSESRPTPIDAAKGERVIRRAVIQRVGARVKDVECPEGLTAQKGATFRCRVIGADGTEGDAIVTERDDRGTVSVSAPFLHVDEVEESIASGISKQADSKVRVRCPEIVPVEAGGAFRCVAKSGSRSRGVRVVQKNARGHVRYELLG
jgi:hypothetical protein